MGKQKYMKRMKFVLSFFPLSLLELVNTYLCWYPPQYYVSMSVEKMYKTLIKEGKVSSNSAKNRKKLYILLKQKGILYHVKITESIKTTRTLNRWIGFQMHAWDLGRVARWIVNKRLVKEDLKEICERDFYSSFPFHSIAQVFSTRSYKEIYQILQREWGNGIEIHKYAPFDYVSLRTTIAMISLK
jgi:hypothetical protein